MILTEEESKFLAYWETNRTRKKSLIWKLAAGLPLGVAMVVAIMANVFAGWFKGASAVIKVDTRLLLVILAAVVGIVVFIVVFSSRHQWDMNEQRYRELQAKRSKSQ